MIFSSVFLIESGYDFHKFLISYFFRNIVQYQWTFSVGNLLITGYRMKTAEMRSWRLIASNNERANMSRWTVLHEGSIDTKDPTLVREFAVTPPCAFKFFRMVATQPGFDGETHIELSYFDFDGSFSACSP